jgi:MFS family permease
MTGPPAPAATSRAEAVNRISAVRFIVGFGVVSALADVVYEDARSIIGPFLGQLGASAAVVGLITGAGEAAALVLRLFTGRLVDRTGRPWAQTITGYALTVLCVPLLGLECGSVGCRGGPAR